LLQDPTQPESATNLPLFYDITGQPTTTPSANPVLLSVPRVTSVLVTRSTDILTSTAGFDTINVDNSIISTDPPPRSIATARVDKIIGGGTQTHGADKFLADPSLASSLTIPFRAGQTLNDVTLQVVVAVVTRGLFRAITTTTRRTRITSWCMARPERFERRPDPGVVQVTYRDYYVVSDAASYAGGSRG